MRTSSFGILCFAGILFATSLAIGAPPSGGQEDVACRVTERAIQKFTTCVFPMEFRGTKEVEVQILGAGVKQQIPWEAKVSNPTITLKQNTRTFSADVKANASGVPWTGKVNGTLEIHYSEPKRALVVAVKDAIVPIRVGPATLEIDVAREIPELPFVIPMPELSFPFRNDQIRVSTSPRLRFIDGAVVIVTDTTFEKE